MISMFGFLAGPLGFIMRLLYDVIQNYGWVIILFTVIVRVLMFPLSLHQQKSMARTQAYQPMIQEIQKKWANDRNRQNEEMQKFYEENQIKMTAGCLPMAVNMIVLFGIIAVIQSPLTYIVGVEPGQIETGVSIMQSYDADLGKTEYTQQSILIGEIKENQQMFIDGGMSADSVEKIDQFNFEFMGMNLAAVPTMEMNRYLILPILSVLSMLGSQLVVMLTSGSGGGSQGKTMMITTVLMGVMFGFIAFTIPVGFSLYYTASNLIMTLQQLIVKRIHNPEKIREQVMQEIEERKAAKKAKKQVKIKDESGAVVTKDMTETELNKARLARARQLDAERYGEEKAEQESEKEKEARETARKQDEEKYGAIPDRKKKGKKQDEEPEPEEKPAELPEAVTEPEAAEAQEQPDAEAPEAAEDEEEPDDENAQKEYKPGRRKRARQNKDKMSFVEQEMQAEQQAKESKESGADE